MRAHPNSNPYEHLHTQKWKEVRVMTNGRDHGSYQEGEERNGTHAVLNTHYSLKRTPDRDVGVGRIWSIDHRYNFRVLRLENAALPLVPIVSPYAIRYKDREDPRSPPDSAPVSSCSSLSCCWKDCDGVYFEDCGLGETHATLMGGGGA